MRPYLRHPGLNLLLLLQGFYKCRFQAVCVFLFESLFDVGGHTQLTDHLYTTFFTLDVFLTLSFHGGFVPLPRWGEICAALSADERCRMWVLHLAIKQYMLHTLFYAQQVNKLCVVGVWNEVHLWGRWLGGRNP